MNSQIIQYRKWQTDVFIYTATNNAIQYHIYDKSCSFTLAVSFDDVVSESHNNRTNVLI